MGVGAGAGPGVGAGAEQFGVHIMADVGAPGLEIIGRAIAKGPGHRKVHMGPGGVILGSILDG